MSYKLLRIMSCFAFSLQGQLNMENFPGYKATGKPLLILFASGKKVKDSVSWKIITRVVKDDSLENQVFFTWMDT